MHHHSHLDFLMICTMLCWTDPTSECLCVKPPLVTDKQREEEEKAIGRRLMKEVSEVWLVKLRHIWVVFIDICRAPVMVQQAKEMQLKSGPGFLFGGFSHIFPSGLTRPAISCSNLQTEEGESWMRRNFFRKGSRQLRLLRCHPGLWRWIPVQAHNMSLSLVFIERCRNVPVQLRSWGSRQKKCSSNLYLNLRFIHILPSGPTTPTINSSNLQTSFFKTSTQNGGQRRRQIRRGWSGRRRRLDGV